MREVSSWGRLSRVPHEVIEMTARASAQQTIAGSPRPGLPFGNGRSYGDVCLNSGGVLWSTRGLDRFLRFDAMTGLLECEAGVTLKEVIDTVLPHGWFPPVTPGTQLLTVGGAIANDVHGKNHHRSGCFGNHVEELTLVRSDGTVIVCGPHTNPLWFAATVGGLGLTGLITTAVLRLRRVPGAWINVERKPFDSLAEFFALSEAALVRWEYSVSWVDCGAGQDGDTRGIFFAGNHADSTTELPAVKSRRMPFTPPFPLVNRGSLRTFNRAYFQANAKPGITTRDYRQFFYPLDRFLDWNRLYGRNGFYQFQGVVPKKDERESTRELLDVIARSGSGSFLSVLKTFGDQPSPGLLSFPMPGTTLALDFPNLGSSTVALLERLAAIVGAAGGRIYAAKDACMPATVFKAGYPAASTTFEDFRDPGISSQLSRRLFGH
jgi:FAD/FMN-containing dehydrogenase